MSKQPQWTGERLETFVQNEATTEHLHRYAMAMELAGGKNVLDIACGEGYGTNLLAGKAAQVTGMDIDTLTIKKAAEKYQQENIQFTEANAEKIPAADNTFDLVISFETLEHVTEQQLMIQEIKRVLKKDGILLLSTPDKKNYSDATGYKNPFHKKELYRNEFESLLQASFRQVKIFGQQITHSSFISVGDTKGFSHYTGNFDTLEKDKPGEPLYFIALASDSELPLLYSSLFTGHSIMEQALMEREKMVTNTISYKLGHFLLYPFKRIRTFLKKKSQA
jgi:ubiquinone/menaquinone biosynthesis C-methylase UbiE